MKLELMLQLKIAIKAQIKQNVWLYVYERNICIFLKNILYILHCAVVATKRARKQ